MDFKFYLNFKNNYFGRIQISEPIKFDAANFVLDQDKLRYGRDVMYANEEISLEFLNDFFEPTSEPIILPNGEVVNHLTHGFDYLKQYYKLYGFESEVEFILEKDNIPFVLGVLDFELAETDEITYFKTKVIQNTKQALIKRREDINVDVFSDKDLDNNYILPVQTKNIYLKAKPIPQISEWTSKNIVNKQIFGDAFSAGIFIPIVNNLTKYGVQTSFAPFDEAANLINPTPTDIRSFIFNNRIITAQENLTNLKININNLSFNGYSNWGRTQITVVSNFYDGNGVFLANGNNSFSIFDTNNDVFSYNDSVQLNIPLLASGESLAIYVSCYFAANNLLNYNTIFYQFKCDGLTVAGTSTAISSVIKGVRHIDLIKQVCQSVSNTNVIAPKYDIGGEFYDNFVFNGKLIRQFSDKPFFAKFKETVSQLQELNADYQINKENIYIGQYDDFYSNNEAGAFLTVPSTNFKSEFNNRYTLTSLEYKYKKFEQDKDELGTIDAVHTESQYLLPNKQVENNKKIEVDYIRDPFAIESARSKSVNTKDTTSLSIDDDIFIIDVVKLAPNSRNGFSRLLRWTASAALNNIIVFTDGTFSFNLLGFNVGDTIKINGNDFTVTELLSNKVTATRNVGAQGNAQQQSILEFDYPLTNAQFTNRTNQEFQIINGIQESDNYSNLQYTIRRNLKHWESYLKTACEFVQSGIIKNTYFKSNGDLITQFRNSQVYRENEDINTDNLRRKIINSKIYQTELIASFDDVLAYLEKMQTINADGSIGGFARIFDNEKRQLKLYSTVLDYNWSKGVLKLTGELKNEGDELVINSLTDGIIEINEVGYARDLIGEISIKANGDFIQLFDNRGIALTNEIYFKNTRVNSIVFSNIVELSNTLVSL